MTNSMQETDKADVILVTGTNTTWNHPVFGGMIKKSVKQKGVKLIVVDPRDIDLAKIADIHLRHNPGTDTAWLMGLQHIIVRENWHNKEFIEERVEGWDEYAKSLEFYTPEKVEEITGIPKDMLYKAAKLYATSGRGALYYAMGITQHTKGVDNVKACAFLQMILGNYGLEGTGVNPLRGQNNVQGACDMGALPNVYPGYQAVTISEVQRKFEDAWSSAGPLTIGLTSTQMLPAAGEGKIRGLYIFGENPMVADPNTNHVRHCLEHTEFLVVQDIFLTETAQLADVVLASASFAETDGTYTNTDRRVQRVRKAIEPIGGSKENWLLICELARTMGAQGFDFPSAQAIMEEINRLTPSYAGITYERLEALGFLQWPCPSVDHPGTPYLHKGKFSRGLGKFFPIEFKEAVELPDPEYPLLLTTGRIMFHYHTGSMTRRSPKLENEAPEAYVEIHADDARQLGLTRRDKRVRVSSRRGEIELGARITNRIRRGVVYIPFHWAEAAANVLTNDALDPVTKTPEYKVCAVKVEAA